MHDCEREVTQYICSVEPFYHTEIAIKLAVRLCKYSLLCKITIYTIMLNISTRTSYLQARLIET